MPAASLPLIGGSDFLTQTLEQSPHSQLLHTPHFCLLSVCFCFSYSHSSPPTTYLLTVTTEPSVRVSEKTPQKGKQPPPGTELSYRLHSLEA